MSKTTLSDHSGVNILAWIIIGILALSAVPVLIPWIIVFALEGGFVVVGWFLLVAVILYALVIVPEIMKKYRNP